MTYIDQQTPQDQKSIQRYLCISNSINEATNLKIVAEMHKYTVKGTPVGELILKLTIKGSN